MNASRYFVAALLAAAAGAARAQYTDGTSYNRGIDLDSVSFEKDQISGTYYIAMYIYCVNADGTAPVDLSTNVTISVIGTTQSSVFAYPCEDVPAAPAACTLCNDSCSRIGTSCRPLNAAACWCATNIYVLAGPFTLTSSNSTVRINVAPAPGSAPADSYTADDTFDVPCSVVHCYANCDKSTTPPVLNVLDFACFLNGYAASGGTGFAFNCDGSTTPPTVNVLDFACFLNHFAAGCPCP